MPIDGLLFTALVSELKERLMNARIQSVHQPKNSDVVLTLRRPGETLHLLISVHPEAARIHLTERSFENPLSPPPFCQVLRKHLIPGRIVGVTQPPFERVAKIAVEGFAPEGGRVERILAAEVMGRHSNLVLIDKAQGAIIDALKRVPAGENAYREILPGRPYVPPPPQEKLDPRTATFEEFEAAIRHTGRSVRIDQALQRAVMGLSPFSAALIADEAGVAEGATREELTDEAARALWDSLRRTVDRIDRGEFAPCAIERDGKADFWCFGEPPAAASVYPSLQALLDAHFEAVEAREAARALRSAIESALRSNRARIQKKLELQRRAVEEAGNADALRKAGDLLTANLYRLREAPPGQTSVILDDFDPEAPKVTVALDPKLTASENAQEYYRKYQKAKKTLEKAAEQLEASKAELAYLESVEASLALAETAADLEEIYEELVSQGYAGEQAQRQRKRRLEQSEPVRLWSSDGFEIRVGRNNKQNDRLTLKAARPEDLWLHAKEIPGAHVVVSARGMEVPERTLREAAVLAAFHSKAKHSSNVPVDYTLCRHVRKPKGARPGMVIYDNHKTLFVTPDEELVSRLKAESGRVRR